MKFFWLLLIFFFACQSIAVEKIVSFDAIIKVNEDASIDVKEKIIVDAEGITIRHGITREFPLSYKDRFNNSYEVRFKLGTTRLNGVAVEAKQESYKNGIILYLGNPNKMLDPGRYEFEINYSTTRQVGFFKDFDELYWNVTGNGWRFAIDSAKATILLPQEVDRNLLGTAGYTGHFGEAGRDYELSIPSGPRVNELTFKSTRSFAQSEGLTVAVGFPKGLVVEPSGYQRSVWFLQDNRGVLILLFGFLMVLVVYIRKALEVRRCNMPGTIIPLFRPPEGFTPAEIRYLSRKGYDAVSLSSEIVHLAIKGYLTIGYEEGAFFGSHYKLTKKKGADSDLAEYQKNILADLFSEGKTVAELKKSKQNKNLFQLVKHFKSHLMAKIAQPYLVRNYLTALIGAAISGVALVAAFVIQPGKPGGAMILLALLLVVTNLLFPFFLTAYTKAGREILDKIEGFKMFLGATEIERLKVIGTPPTKTPELFEKYLPFAMALGVEERWTKQFTPVFRQMEEEQNAYAPAWYAGAYGATFSASDISKGFSSSFSSAISSSTTPPGSSSGSSGGGSSGGGGGGGGVGGW